MIEKETKTCQNCKNSFAIEPEDFAFYEKIKVPPPTFCPECRLIRRLAFRNERSLYKRKCDLCRKEKIFIYPPDSPFKIYCKECWWSDKWSAKEYGRDYDFSKPFFEQFKELLLTVPRAGIIQQGNSVNSEYTNRVTDLKNCYLVFGTVGAEDSRYGTWLNYSKNCMDGYAVQKSEQCYECINCFQCYNLHFSKECNNCSDSAFLLNCNNCNNCFGCTNLRNKSYCIFNKQYTQEEYQKLIGQYNLGSRFTLEKLKAKFAALSANIIVPALISRHSVNSSGNWIESCKNLYKSFNCTNVEDSRYCYSLLNAKDSMDHSFWGNPSERIYEANSIGIQCANVRFASECWSQLLDSEYCMNCHNSTNLFGCAGLRNAEYCILNKQYPKKEYELLVAKIKEQMMEMPYTDKGGRKYAYGEFFPGELSPHAYNKSIAHEFFPTPKATVLKQGYPWRDPEIKTYSVTLPADQLPDQINEATDSILKEAIGCAHSGKCDQQCTSVFRIIPEELQFYRARNIALPKLCPNCRHYERLAKRNPLKLWHRQCACAGTQSDNAIYKNTISHFHGSDHCVNEFETSYAPDRPEIVYCEQCYQSEVV